MTKTAAAATPTLALVREVQQTNAGTAPPMTAAERVKAAAAVAKAEAATALDELVAKITAARDDAHDLGGLDTYPEAVRDQMKKFVASANSVLDTFNRPTR